MAGEAVSVERWREIEHLFDQVADLEPEARRQHLAEACRGDEELCRQVEFLLASDAQAEEVLRGLDFLTATRELPTVSAPDMPPPGASEIEGTLIGPYRLLERLGQGGMGVVYKARDLRLDRPVALKFLLSSPEGDAKRRLLEEARAAAALDHVNICTVYEVEEAPDHQVFMAMACYEGQTLKERLARGPLAVDEAVELAVQVARGLAAAHRRGIVHCDVKPSNILITADGVAKLCDFGLAQIAGSEAPAQVGTRGTPAYMAPERFGGERASVRSDLWSLGVVLHEMLGGDLPPRTLTALRRSVPAALDRVVRRLLAKDPGERYASAEVLLADLQGLGTSTGAPGARPQSSRPRLAKPLAAAAALLVLSALGWAASGLARHRTPPVERPLEAVAVLPFEVQGNPELTFLREGLVELLATRLDGAGNVRGVDPNAVLVLARRSAGEERDAEQGRAIAARFGAGHFVLGNVLDLGGAVRLSAFLYDAGGRLAAHEEVVAADGGALTAAVDELARRILARLLGSAPGGRLGGLAALTTGSLPALRAYLAGEEAMRDGRFEKAEEAFRQAVALDETFSLAWYRLARAAVWTHSSVLRPALEQALRYQERLGERDRLLVQAAQAAQARKAAEAESLYRQLLARYPDDAEAWQMLGDVIYHNNRRQGRSPGEARLPLERALSYLPGHRETLVHLMDIALKERRFDDFEALAKPFVETPSGDPEGWVEIPAYRALRALVHGAERESVIAELRLLGPRVVRDALWRTFGLLEDLESAQRMAEVLVEIADSPSWEAEGRSWLWRIALARGRIEEAEAAFRDPVPPGHRLVFRTLLYAHPFSPYPAERLPELEREVRAWDPVAAPLVDLDGRPLHPGEEEVVRSYLLGLLAVRRGDGEAVERSRRALDEGGGDQLARALSQMLAASEAWRRERDREALVALDRVRALNDEMILSGTSSSFTAELANADFLRAEILARENRPQEALALFRTLTDGSDVGLFLLAPSYMRRAQVAEEMGDGAQAAACYRRFVDLWPGSPPKVGPYLSGVAAVAREDLW